MDLSTDAVGARLDRPGAGRLVDLDGTLVRSEEAHQGAFQVYFASRGWTVADDVVREFSGRRAHEVFATLAGPWGDGSPTAMPGAGSTTAIAGAAMATPAWAWAWVPSKK